MTQTATTTITRELQIDASPETVYEFLTDPAKIVQWMAREASVEARPGGAISFDYNGFDVMRGEIVELTPPSRVIYTWGWEASDSPVPGVASTVAFSLEARGGGTALRMVHDRLPTGADGEHAEGWDHFLPRLVERAAGRDPGPDSWTPHAAELIAADLRDELAELRSLIEGCSDEAWRGTRGAEGWSLGVTAHHAIGHLNLVEMISGFASSGGGPVTEFTLDAIDAQNAAHAKEFAEVSREQTLAALDESRPAAITGLREFPADKLETVAPMAFAGGAEVSALDLLRGPLLADIGVHIESLKAAR